MFTFIHRKRQQKKIKRQQNGIVADKPKENRKWKQLRGNAKLQAIEPSPEQPPKRKIKPLSEIPIEELFVESSKPQEKSYFGRKSIQTTSTPFRANPSHILSSDDSLRSCAIERSKINGLITRRKKLIDRKQLTYRQDTFDFDLNTIAHQSAIGNTSNDMSEYSTELNESGDTNRDTTTELPSMQSFVLNATKNDSLEKSESDKSSGSNEQRSQRTNIYLLRSSTRKLLGINSSESIGNSFKEAQSKDESSSKLANQSLEPVSIECKKISNQSNDISVSSTSCKFTSTSTTVAPIVIQQPKFSSKPRVGFDINESIHESSLKPLEVSIAKTKIKGGKWRRTIFEIRKNKLTKCKFLSSIEVNLVAFINV